MIFEEKKEGHVKKSVVVGISGKTQAIRKKTLIIRKNANIQQKNGTFGKKSVVVGISGKTLTIWKSVDTPAKR